MTELITTLNFFAVAEAAEPLKFSFLNAKWLTNSFLVSIIVFLIIFIIAKGATKKMKFIPNGLQNFFEALIEGAYTTVESVVGDKLVSRAFPLLCTIFIYFLVSNWFGLVPGVGTIGWGFQSDAGFIVQTPMLRPPAADINNNIAISLIFMIVWLFITIKSVGVGGFISHTFGVKGSFKGISFVVFSLIFFLVGIIEMVSIAFRPVSLSLRIYGNIFAGENLLHVMADLGNKLGFNETFSYILKIVAPFPFYFLELLVGFLQAVVFALLCAVYIRLSAFHEEEEH